LNILDHFSESFETVFRAKILKFFDADADPGSGIEKFGSRDKHPGSATLGFLTLAASPPRKG
jgi:hypothetical protein